MGMGKEWDDKRGKEKGKGYWMKNVGGELIMEWVDVGTGLGGGGGFELGVETSGRTL
jgi:hypothetical protein